MLVITLGEVWGTNLELLGRLWFESSELATLAKQQPVCLVGSRTQWHDQWSRLAWSIPPWPTMKLSTLSTAFAPQAGMHWLDTDEDDALLIPAERLSEQQRGSMAVSALHAVPLLTTCAEQQGQKLAVATGPIDKHACHAAGFTYPGQTEYFADIWQGAAVMLLAGPRLRVGLATNHLALGAVAGTITAEIITQKLQLLHDSLQRYFGIQAPRLGVAALNPHASDGGLFGDEEERILRPAIAKSKAMGLHTTGPLPADTIFYRAHQGDFDAVLAMYHDQGLGPFKTVHFDSGINLSGGLKHLRLSPDHGPARDLFLQKRASLSSWQQALAVASQYLLDPCASSDHPKLL